MILGTIFYLSIPVIILLFDFLSRFLIGKVFSYKNISCVQIGKKQLSKDALHKIIAFGFCVLFLTCVCAFRSTYVGSDTRSYFDFYEETKGYTFQKALQPNANLEPGFVFYNYIFASIKTPYYLFAFITYIIIFVSVVWCCFVFSKYPTISVCLYVCFTFFVLNLSTIRQSLAFAFCLYALLIFYLTKKHYFLKLLAFIPIAIALTIHVSSLAFMIVFILYFIKIKSKNAFLIYFLSLFTFVLFFPAISSIIFQIFTNPSKVYSFYPPSSSNTSISGTLVLLVISALGFMVCNVFSLKADLSLSKTKINNDSKFSYFIAPLFNDKDIDSQISFSLIIFQIVFILLDNTIFLLSRVATYGSLGFCILIPNWIHSASKEKPNNLFLFLIVLIGMLYFFYAVLRINYLTILPYGAF